MIKGIKKFCAFAMFLSLTAAALAGCGQDKEDVFAGSQYDSDLDYIQDKGSLVVGVTEFEPLDFMQDGKWVGFDAQMAGLFAQSLGVTAEFVEIDWDRKVDLLNKGTIDCVWNGMTLTDEVQAEMSCSVAYLNNAQIIVVPSRNSGQIQTVEDCMHLLFAVEAGSAGEQELADRNYRYTTMGTQLDALQSVDSGKADAAVIDAVMAGSLIGPGKQFESLVDTAALSSEEYGIGFRKNSDLAELLNAFWKENLEDGTVDAAARQYGVQAAVIGLGQP